MNQAPNSTSNSAISQTKFFSFAIMALLAAFYGISAYLSVKLTIDTGRVAAFWLGNAILIGVLLHRPIYIKILLIFSCMILNVFANLANADAFPLALGLSLTNMSEITIALILIERFYSRKQTFDRLEQIGLISLIGVGVPAATGIMASSVLLYTDQGPFFENWGRWFAAHGIAIPIFTSMILIMRDFLRSNIKLDRIALSNWGSVGVSFVVTVIAVFFQTTYPFLFLALPIVVYAAFRTGMLGTALTVAAFAIAASIATYLGYGPISLVKGGVREEMIALQVFLAACLMVGLPVAALLDNRETVRRELRENRDFIASIVDGVGEVVFKVDRNWRWTYLNRQWSVLTGEASDQMIGQAAFASIHRDDRSELASLVDAIEAGRKPNEKILLRLDIANKPLIHIAIGIEPLFDYNGQFCGAIGNFSDVSERIGRERVLAESEARFRRLAEASPVGIFQADAKGDLTYVNSAWLKRFDLSADQMLGEGWKTALATGEEYESDPAFSGFKKPGDVRRRIIKFLDGEGNDLWCETVNAAEFDEGGNIVGFVGVLNDITEQRKATERLIESERRFQVLADMAPAGIFRTDPQGNCTYVNEAWKNQAGLTDGEWEGLGWSKALHSYDAERIQSLWSAAVESGQPFDDEFRWLRPDGSTVCIHVVSGPEIDQNGDVAGYIGVTADISERKRTHGKLIEREAQLSLLADNATDAVLRLGLDGVCKYASPSAKRVFGVEHSVLVGQQFITGFHKDDQETVEAEFASLAQGDKDQVRLAFRSESLVYPGTFNWLEASCGLVRDGSTGQPSEVIASLRNVNQTKLLEADLILARIAAEAAVESKSAFLANMSHEIRTPMNGVIGFTELALMGDVSAEQRAQLEMIADSGRAMLRLLNDVLDLAKIEAGQMTVANEPTDLGHKMLGCLRLMEPVAKKNGLSLTMKVANDVPHWINTDPMRIRQIILNLLGNALKFTKQGRVIFEAAVDRSGSEPVIRIDVRDTGIGIPADRIASVFDKFTQADESTARQFGGTGLGLPISAQLAQMLGGELSATSRPGIGSTFTLILPLNECEPPEAAQATDDGAILQSCASGLRVLVAEDNVINQRLTLSMLDKVGLTADLAQNGAQAIAMVEEQSKRGKPYGIVLMDIQMPELDGLQATRKLRASGYDAVLLPIVALTANAYPEDIAECRAAGMQAHLAKPLRLRELEAALVTWGNTEPTVVNSQIEEETDPQLVQMYRERKQGAIITIDEALREGKFEGKTLDALAAQFHQIAGVAAFFGEAQLGKDSSEIENGLPLCKLAEVPAMLQDIRKKLVA